MEKEAQELQDKLNALQNTIFRGNEKLDHFRQLMNWNQVQSIPLLSTKMRSRCWYAVSVSDARHGT